MKILIDNGHGYNTPGKCSPDKRLLEWKYTREIATELLARLKAAGFDAERIVTEDVDISLKERCRRVNAICKRVGASNVVLVSIHNNAAGSGGKWRDATGWCGFVYTKASSRSCHLAQLLYAEAEKRGLKGNRSVPREHYWMKNLAIVRDTACPAVLTENLFQDNKGEVDFLLSPQGREAIVSLHFDALIKYVSE
ncbi:N-acetylmuramoyl-L-alanine amidase [Pseudoprevotella muciniphila]|uniref:N-acetylmuramoyl-L-alanine amidase n=1 Tax=Pseudoprevotella muciniphila TaxID=2133944 RepID=A0A5P8E8L7_9BACT|nr:N-acetylmuramoyl-L-alanine amidase [Pseudoprevotella muciniphila]QFQ13282.1 N-acetylmuramoyl-L-alanine amidase [Pseudoprevotella muciniphila]